MKKVIAFLLILLVAGACKKKDKTEEETTIAPAVVPPAAPVFFYGIPNDAYGVLTASQSGYEFSNNYVTQLGKANAYFYAGPGDYHYVDAGTVQCNDSVLIKQSSGSYWFNGKPVNGQPLSGIHMASGITWSVSGTTSVPAFTFSTATFPVQAALTSGTVISKTNAYTATFSGAANADSVVVILLGDSVNLQKKTVSATAGSCNFTAAQIGAVKKKGSSYQAFINLVSYQLLPNTVSGKKYYMVNSNTSSYLVSIQ